jgi:DNA-3-methyladenine glycosylase
MGIDVRHNGIDLLGGSLRLEHGARLVAHRVARAPRVGVPYAGADAALPWRLYERDNPAVSRSGRPSRPPAAKLR